MRSRLCVGAALAFAAVLGACGDSTGPVLNPVGTVRFTYEGARSGTFDAVGRFPSASIRSPTTGTWAVALRLRGGPAPGDGPLGVLAASQRRSDARADVFSILFVPVEARTVSCDVDDTSLCPMFVQLRFGVPPTVGDAEAEFVIVAGTVSVTEASDTRLRGTFELALRESGSGALLQVSDGTFDVPLVEPQFGVLDRIPAR